MDAMLDLPIDREVELHLTSGYGRQALDDAFEGIRDPADWKGPISALIPADRVAICEAAIIFFTATRPTTRPADDMPGAVWIEADGYRIGPAGP